jgi:NADPH-dependent 2,4-dienoyl-CoA reductase/sulfur reductase-like enzyme/rhodanese-related sulfurtransferase
MTVPFTEMKMAEKIVIIGGVAAGATAAAKARRTDEKCEITLIEKGKYISYANCGLPYYAAGIIKSKKDILLNTPEKFSKRFNLTVLVNTEAVAIDRKKKTVTIKDKKATKEIPYDKLIIAVGGKTVIPPIKGINDVPYFTMRTVDDADNFRRFVTKQNPKTAIVIGGGFIGVETAEALMHRGLKTTVVEAKAEIMPNLPPAVAINLREYMESKKIKFKLGVFAESVEYSGKKVILKLSDGSELKADMLLVCTGVVPDTTLAESCGLKIGKTGGIEVDETMRTSDPSIFAAGDAAEKVSFFTGKKILLPLAGAANRQGRVAGAQAVSAKEDMTFPPVIGTSIVGFDGFSAGMTGLSLEQAKQAGFDADCVFTEDNDISGYYPGAEPIFLMTVFEKKTGRLLGCAGSGIKGVDKRLDSASVAIYSKLSVFDLEDIEFAYAPQFAKARDNLNVAGFAAANKLRGVGFSITPDELSELRKKGEIQLVDVRNEEEYAQVQMKEAINIPLNTLRDSMDKLDKSKPVYVHCAVGLRGYLAVRVLRGNGFEAYNVSGGIRAAKRHKLPNC